MKYTIDTICKKLVGIDNHNKSQIQYPAEILRAEFVR